MSIQDPMDADDQKVGKRQGGNVETKGASKAPPAGEHAEQGGAGEGQPDTSEAENKG